MEGITSYTKITLCVCVLLNMTSFLTHADDTVIISKDGTVLLEKKKMEIIAFFKKEFYSETNQLKASADGSKAAAATLNKYATKDNLLQDVEQNFTVNTLHNQERDMLTNLPQLKDTFQSKRLKKRDVNQHKFGSDDLSQLNTTGHHEVLSVVTEIGNYLSSQIDKMTLENIENKMDVMIEILREIKEHNGKPDTHPAVDCANLYRRGHVTSGVYRVFPRDMWRPLHVYCDMETDGGGWTVFQRRCDGSENFTRSWNDYRFGFGNLSSEFWLGNEYVSRMTSQGPHELRIELENFENDRRYAKYALFEIAPFSEKFKLTVEDFNGNVSDILLKCHNNKQFSTFDRVISDKYARRYKGGFWYSRHQCVNLNGIYSKENHRSHVNRKHFKGGRQLSLKFSEMKFRPN